MTSAPRQLALDLALPESLGREDFLATEASEAALAMIDSYPDWPASTVALVGPKGSGKSHLGAIFAETAGARRLAARDLAETTPAEALATGALLLEDAGPRTPETALFHLINAAKEEGAFLLITTRDMPARWGTSLKDLASRLRALTTVELAPPDDQLLRAVLIKLFADRQMTVDPEIVEYCARRMERSLDAARRLVAALDRETLETGRRLTRPLAGMVLDRIMQPSLI